MVDKNKAIIEFLRQCPQLENNKMFFNFAEAGSDNKQIIIDASDKILNTPYINGDVLKRFTFTIIDYRSITYDPLMKAFGVEENENVEELLDCQSILNWIDEQAKIGNLPNFGNDCIIEEMKALTNNPNLNGTQSLGSLTLAKYSIAIQIEYLDISGRNWN